MSRECNRADDYVTLHIVLIYRVTTTNNLTRTSSSNHQSHQQTMKSIFALTLVMLATAAAAKPTMAPPSGNQCHSFVPAKSRPAFTYFQCDLTCVLANPKNVSCSFVIDKVNEVIS